MGQVAMEMAQREQRDVMQPQDNMARDGLTNNYHPGGARQEQSRACGQKRAVQTQIELQENQDPESRSSLRQA